MCNGIASRVKSVVRGRIKEIGTWENRIKEKRERERERMGWEGRLHLRQVAANRPGVAV